eukprot:Pgem_evm1s7366
MIRSSSNRGITGNVEENEYTHVSCRIFGAEHNKPNRKTKYFIPSIDVTNKKKHGRDPTKMVTVVLPFFNEEKQELQRSLISLWHQEKECLSLSNNHEELKGITFQFVAIMDGYYKASDSMVDYVCEMFGDKWLNNDYSLGDDNDNTKILQKTNASGFSGKVMIGENKYLNLALVIKKQNRKKTNSHEWFFRAFVPEFNATYAFSTDCGTLYAPNCLRDMICYLHNHKDVSAVTGRQRVMDTDMQNV